MKLYGYKDMKLSLISNFENAFVDTDMYKIADLSQEFEGFNQLQFSSEYEG